MSKRFVETIGTDTVLSVADRAYLEKHMRWLQMNGWHTKSIYFASLLINSKKVVDKIQN